MNFIKIVLPLVLFIFIGCADGAKDSEKESATTTTTSTDQAPMVSQPPPPPAQRPTEPPQNAAGVWHYTCAKGCAGGAGAAQPCAVCGDMLAHNKAYHDNADQNSNITVNSSNSAATKISPVITGPGATQIQQQQMPATRKVEPPQNAAGVWHFTCAQGCAGGSGDKSAKCAGCGGALAHNAAYHNK